MLTYSGFFLYIQTIYPDGKRNIQRGQVLQILQMPQRLLVDLHRALVVAPMHHPVAYIREILVAGDLGEFRVREAALEEELERVWRRRHRLLQLLLVLRFPPRVLERLRGRREA
jgi:hypothetical protein